MWSSRGRPKSACTACKSQKIRCSGEHPICKRCARLTRMCVYTPTASTARSLRFISDSENRNKRAVKYNELGRKDNCMKYSDTGQSNLEGHQLTEESVISSMREDIPHFGIFESLMYTLVDVYFETAYNAGLLLHKRRFLESLEAGTVEPHLILSMCAYAANFYRDQNGEATLRDNGYMTEWAKRAGSLVFRDVEMLREDNIVTFCILGTFWYGQGSWRLSYLHKANACNILHITGLSFLKHHEANSLDSEIRRRRFWACYLMQCALMENPALFDPIANVSELPLPLAEADLDAGQAHDPPATLKNARPSTCIFAELVRGFKIWCTVFALVRLPESSVGGRFAEIYALDDTLTDWWSALQPGFKLAPAALPNMPTHQLSHTLLLNAVYHQCMCALHASVVPLFSWTPSESSWTSARQASAQKAYEHASAVSNLITATLTSHPQLAITHSFLAYAAYSGCAVQVPFMWSSNPVIKKQATVNVSKNVRMIQSMTPYWKFATLVQKQFSCLYRVHERFPVDLEDEPKNIDVKKLLAFKINAANARTSILGFTEILRSKDHGYANSGEEDSDLGIQCQSNESVSQATDITLPNHEHHVTPLVDNTRPVTLAEEEINLLQGPTILQSAENFHLTSDQSDHSHRIQAQTPHSEFCGDQNEFSLEQLSYGIWPPFFYPTMSDLLPGNGMFDLPQIDMNPIDLDHFEPMNWFASTNA